MCAVFNLQPVLVAVTVQCICNL